MHRFKRAGYPLIASCLFACARSADMEGRFTQTVDGTEQARLTRTEGSWVSPAPRPTSTLHFVREPAMTTCRICRFETELDDVAVRSDAGRCICLRCYGRETGSARPMSKALQRQLSAALAERNLA